MKLSKFGVAVLAATGLAGCGSSDETAAYRLVPVTGVVTLNGKPLEDAEISFTPDGKNEARTPGGDKTGPEGNYKAMFRGRSGLAPGKYTVVISKTILPGAAKNISDEMKDDPLMVQMALEAKAKAGGQPAKSSEALAMKVESSFQREVEAKGSVLDFDVKGKPSTIDAKAKPAAAAPGQK